MPSIRLQYKCYVCGRRVEAIDDTDVPICTPACRSILAGYIAATAKDEQGPPERSAPARPRGALREPMRDVRRQALPGSSGQESGDEAGPLRLRDER